jgi:hypothetical protein
VLNSPQWTASALKAWRTARRERHLHDADLWKHSGLAQGGNVRMGTKSATTPATAPW